MVDTGTIPAAGKLRDEVPPGLVDDHAPARRRARSARARCTTSWASTRSTRCARRRETGGCATRRASARSSRRACSPRSRPAPPTSRRSAWSCRPALEVGEQVVEALRAHPAAMRVEIAGSARRLADSVKDLDIIATAHGPGRAGRRAAPASTRWSPRAPPARTPRAAARTTAWASTCGSSSPTSSATCCSTSPAPSEHNVALREAAVRRGLHVSEYGILDDETGETMRCATEEEVYERLGLPWIPPELREDRGELARRLRGRSRARDRRGPARRSALPHDASDGRSTIEEMARAAHRRAATSTSRSPTTRRRTASATT